jgi:cellulose synthase operon protein C
MALSFFRTFVLTASLFLAACQTAEEKAEEYYQSGLAYLADGDTDRAIIELRNVFQYNGFHKEARKTYADLLLAQGNVQDAYSQYLRLIEQYPDTVEVRKTLAELAINNNSWDEAERHGSAALSLAPDDPTLQPVRLALAYRAAVVAESADQIASVADEAEAFLQTVPDSMILRRIVIDRLINEDRIAEALPILDAALVQTPDRLDLQMLRLSLLTQMNEIDAAGEQLRKMAVLFPDNTDVQSALINWYMVNDDFDGAESYLRQIAGAKDGPVDGHLAVIQLLQTTKGAEAARVELDSLLAANTGNPNADLYAAMIAMLDFDAGDQDGAIASLERIIAAAEPSDQTRKIQVLLARVLNATPEARQRAVENVEAVLSADPGNVEALKMRAAWAIDDDRVGDAIVDLRAALDQNPSDSQILALMAAAHERDGSTDLAGERLAMAVEVSGGAVAESLSYAQFLVRQGRLQAVEAVLTEASNKNPSSPEVLAALAQYYISQAQWSRAEETISTLEALPLTDQGSTVARQLRAESLARQNKIDESLALLQQGVSASSPASAVIPVLETQVRAGKLTEARSYLDSILRTNPDDPSLRLVSGTIDLLMENPDAAEKTWRALIAEEPSAEAPVRLLYAMLRNTDRKAEATEVLNAALAAQPGSNVLRWMQAGELESGGKIDEAIAVYEAMYAENSNNLIVANNLASLIATHRMDDESLARAEVIARRLRDSTEPAFQDTYGWIAFRRGNLDEALRNLEPAATGLPQDPIVQFHLGMIYDALGRRDDAIRQLEAALAIAGDDSQIPQMTEAKAVIDRLQNPAP